MVNVSLFRGVIDFFDEVGIYDVVLPFLLVFTIVFAVFEKTKVFGTEEIEGVKYSKKNLNAMVSFVISFLVVASSRLVALINEALANIVVLLLLSISFLILVGSFHEETEKGIFLEKGWKQLFMGIMFVGIVLIFLHAVKLESGENWLDWVWSWLAENWSSTAAGSIILVIIIVAFMAYVVGGEKKSIKQKKES